jgi:hypothetical protein
VGGAIIFAGVLWNLKAETRRRLAPVHSQPAPARAGSTHDG